MTTVVTDNRQTERIENIYARSVRYDTLKSDAVAKAAELRFHPVEDDDGADLSLWFPPDLFGQMAPLSLTDWALQQACNRLGPPPMRYIRQCPGWLQARNLNHWLGDLNPDAKWLARIYDGRVRAILSNEYSIVNNSTILDIVLEMLGDQGLIDGHRLTRPHISPDALYLRVSLIELRKDAYEAGFFVSNGEIGNLQIRFAPYVKRNACDNSMIVMGDRGFLHPHRWHSAAWLRGTFREMAGQMLGYAEHALDDIVRSEMERVPTLTSVIDRLVEANGFSQIVRDNILIGTEGQRTRMGLINGLSFAAHITPELEEDARTNMEIMAGSILAHPSDLFGALARQKVNVEATEE